MAAAEKNINWLIVDGSWYNLAPKFYNLAKSMIYKPSTMNYLQTNYE